MLRNEWESEAKSLLGIDRFDSNRVIDVLSDKGWADFNYDMAAKRTSTGDIAWKRMRDSYEKKAPVMLALGFEFNLGGGSVKEKWFEA